MDSGVPIRANSLFDLYHSWLRKCVLLNFEPELERKFREQREGVGGAGELADV
jgi:hypothetical protein